MIHTGHKKQHSTVRMIRLKWIEWAGKQTNNALQDKKNILWLIDDQKWARLSLFSLHWLKHPFIMSESSEDRALSPLKPDLRGVLGDLDVTGTGMIGKNRPPNTF